MKRLLKKFKQDNSGAVTVEASLVIMILIILTGGSIEAGYAFHQYNGAQQAARTGVRIAATSNPVSRDIARLQGVPSQSDERYCNDETRRCSRGQYDAAAMQRIKFGPDGDGTCGPTSRARRGMCDVFNDAQYAHVDVAYIASGLTGNGQQFDTTPLVSVTLRDVPLNFIFLDLIGFQNLVHLPPVEATLMGEDLRNG